MSTSGVIDLVGTVGALLLFVFIAAFMAAYSLGLRKNRMLLEEYYTLVSEWVKEGFRVIDKKTYRLSGFKIRCKSMGAPLESLDITLYLVSRENLLHHLVSKFKPHDDVFLCEANFRVKPRFSMEIINPERVSLSGGMEKVAVVGELEVWASDADAASKLLERGIREEIEELSGSLIRASLRDDRPHLVYSFTPSKSKIVAALKLAEKFGEHFRPAKPKPKILKG
ncbi:MAG: hypothetical protein KIH01_01660 [Candidatus Freyarchaeota archaeon]|nr:hypothetical protein [Candidatus Jordarchaeia archaeon]